MAEAFSEKYIVVKEKYVGHEQKKKTRLRIKRIETKQRGKKQFNGKVIGGKGRLTEKTIDKTQNYFGEAIRNNVGNIESTENDIWTIFKYMI